MVRKFDFLVIGSGIAGMSFALKVAHKGKVALICKSGLEEANTYFAQGGVASVTNLLVDNFDKHIEDTMIAGDWISNRAAVEKVVREAPAQIEELIKWGVDFDKNEKGEFDLHREGGHSEFRILHHKDNTGAEIQDSLIKAVQRHPNITVIENQFAIEILTQHHLGVTVTRQTPDIKCYGAYILDPKTGKVDIVLANFTVTKERAEQVDFALPYMKVALGVVSPAKANITSIDQLKDKLLIVAKGTTAETYFAKHHPEVKLLKFDQYTETFNALLDGRGAAFSTDNTEVLAWAMKNPDFKVGITSLGDLDTIAPAVQKGNKELLAYINDEIKKLGEENFFHKNYEATLAPVYGSAVNPDDLVVEGGEVKK